MKNKFLRFSANFILMAIAGMLLSFLIINAAAYVTYKIFNIADLRDAVRWVYRIFDLASSFSLYYIILFAITLSFFITYLFTRRITKRMNAIHNAVIQIQKGEYHVLLPNDNKDALGEMEHNINSLAIEINDTLTRQKEVEQSKDDFIVNIAHDLRTPLTSIIGYLSFISEKQLAPDISTKYARIAYEKSKQLERLIESLFDIANLSTNLNEITKDELNLNKILLQKQDELYPQLQAADMEIRLKLSEPLSVIHADGTLLARVFDNLISNAIRFAKEGHYIDIETEKQQNKVRISLVTHSNPVPVNDLEKIFEKLYRLEKSRSAQTGGTGLGLSISRRIIELHGGTLTARQAENGTAFDIYLPV